MLPCLIRAAPGPPIVLHLSRYSTRMLSMTSFGCLECPKPLTVGSPCPHRLKKTCFVVEVGMQTRRFTLNASDIALPYLCVSKSLLFPFIFRDIPLRRCQWCVLAAFGAKNPSQHVPHAPYENDTSRGIIGVGDVEFGTLDAWGATLIHGSSCPPISVHSRYPCRTLSIARPGFLW